MPMLSPLTTAASHGGGAAADDGDAFDHRSLVSQSVDGCLTSAERAASVAAISMLLFHACI